LGLSIRSHLRFRIITRTGSPQPGFFVRRGTRDKIVRLKGPPPEIVGALEKGQVAGAALDVFEEEPLALDSPLRKMGDKVLLSPHMVSANVGSGLGPGIRWATNSVLCALRGEVPDNVYNKEVIDQWKSRFGGKSVWQRGY